MSSSVFCDLKDAPACIKIDVEGHEIQVIQGAQKLIERWHPPMVVEVNMESNNYSSFKKEMQTFGYSLYQIQSYGPNVYFDRVDMHKAASEDIINSNDFLAVRNEALERKILQYCK